MRRITMIVPMIAAMLLFTGYESGAGNTPAPLSTAELKQAFSAGKKTIVFFLNPQGGPCKAQNEVLTKLQQDRKGNFVVAFVDAMKPANQQAFYDYGVRSLPTVVLVDSKGKISRAFPPGIQTYEALAKALDGALLMDLGIANILLAVGAGLASVLSPCVLPVIPVVMAGAERKDRLRPLLVVLGLAVTFMIMGAISSLFGELLIGRTRTIELVGAVVILAMGFLVLFDLNIFKRLYRLSNIPVKSEGRFGGLVLGMALGLVWVPCIGPFLSSILTMVGTSGQLARGTTLLGFYSLGLAVPMLAVAYSSHLLQSKLRVLAQHETALRFVTGSVLVGFGLYSIVLGNVAF